MNHDADRSDDALVGRESPSGMQRNIGYRVTEWREDFARVELTIEEKHRNRSGRVHGGIIATLIDTAAGYCGCYSATGAPRYALTLSLTINFIGSPAGCRLIATGRRTGGGSNIYFCEVDLRDELDTAIATGIGTFRYRRGGAAAPMDRDG